MKWRTFSTAPYLISAFHPCLSSFFSSSQPHWLTPALHTACNLRPFILSWQHLDPSSFNPCPPFSNQPSLVKLDPFSVPDNTHKKWDLFIYFLHCSLEFLPHLNLLELSVWWSCFFLVLIFSPSLCVLQLRCEEFSQPPRVCEYKLITKADVNGLSCRRGSSEKKKKKTKLKSKKPSSRSVSYI